MKLFNASPTPGARRVPGALATLALLGGLIACGGTSEVEDTSLFHALAAGSFLPAAIDQDLSIDPSEGGDESYWLPKLFEVEDGWVRRDHFAAWAEGEASTLGVYPVFEGAARLQLTYQIHGGFEQAVGLSWDGGQLGPKELDPPQGELVFDLSEGVLDEGRNRFELSYEKPPGDTMVPGTEGLGFRHLVLAPPGWEERDPDEPTHVLDAEAQRLVVLAPGVFVAPVRAPEGRPRIRLDLRYRGPAAETEPGRLRLLALGTDGRSQELAARDDLASAEREISAALDGFEGELFFLAIEARIPAAGARLELSGLSWEEPAAPKQKVKPVAVADGGQKPDVVLIVLDAARADHFSSYGYFRETTPQIDRQLAAEGMVFTRAYSECPNTSCSMPNMISGLPFLNIGDELETRYIADDVVTLAEELKELGYRTVSYSGNPNNSIGRNSHQGFDEFHQMWEGKRGRERVSPFILSERAIETIENQDPGEPLYLQLHYVPPHEPYAPMRRYDLFTDPEYEGPISGKIRISRAIREGKLVIDEKDLVQLVGLYDGNLLMADAAVAQVFEALKRTGRWDNSIVLLTSDHGEAFMEHGEQGHNSTAYDEMLYVPFILKLPGGEKPEGVVTDRLASVADVLPTVLGRLGVEPDPRVVGIDVVGSAVDPSRVTFHRSMPWSRGVIYSARSTQWKSLVQTVFSRQELYDLRADPGELDNVMHENPLIFTALTGLLREHMRLAERLTEAGGEIELTPEDEEALKALGYL